MTKLAVRRSWIRKAEQTLLARIRRERDRLFQARCKRNQQVVAMYAGGATMQKIGDHFGITRQRVKQILLTAEAAE